MSKEFFKIHFENVRRFAVILSLCVWFGGFTFYAGVVIHTNHQVLHNSRESGFLTQQVTVWLNLIGVPALAILFWNLVVLWPAQKRWVRSTLLLTWLIMAGFECCLFAMHPMLDRLLDLETHKILERGKFHRLHELYVNLSTCQWMATLLYLWSCLSGWRARDGAAQDPK